jgi:Leucine-rich repeat (LRR) protein
MREPTTLSLVRQDLGSVVLPASFSRLSALTMLDFSENRIASLRTDAPTLATQLLSLARNQLRDFPIDVVRRMPALVFLLVRRRRRSR